MGSLSLVDSIITFMIAFPIIAGMHILTHYLWKHRINRRFYEELLLPRKQQDAGKRRTKKTRFIPIPGIFVFPSFLSLLCCFFITGFVESSVSLIAQCSVITETSGSWQVACMLPAVIVLMFCAAFLLIAISIVHHFHRVHALELWEDLIVPDDPDEVVDPLYRWVSKFRVRFLPKRKPAIMERERGEFVRDDEAIEEPTRTERILGQPMALYRSVGADAFDANKIMLLNRSSWSRRSRRRALMGVFYDITTFVMQCVIACVASVGPAITPGTSAAIQQMVVICCLQFFTSIYVVSQGVSVDRIDQWITGGQFLLEGLVTMLTLVSATTDDADAAERMQGNIFILAIFAMMMPTLEKTYDLFVLQASKILRYKKQGGEFTLPCSGVCVLRLLPDGVLFHRRFGWLAGRRQRESRW